MRVLACEGCGKTAPGPLDVPVASRCGDCPPWHCDRCDRMVDINTQFNCDSCVIRFAGRPLADIKGLLAEADLSVDIP